MVYDLIAKLPPHLQGTALLLLPSQKVVAGALAGALTALLAAVAVKVGVEVPAEASSAVTALSAALAAYLVPQRPDTPRAQAQRGVRRAQLDPRRNDTDERIAITRAVQAVARERL